MPIDVEQARPLDPLPLDLLRPHLERLVPAPKDGPLAGGFVHEDISELAPPAGDDQPVRFDALALELPLLELAGLVVANAADVARRESPPVAGHQGARYLAAGLPLDRAHPRLRVEGGEVGQPDDGVGGVQPDANHVDDFDSSAHARHH